MRFACTPAVNTVNVESSRYRMSGFPGLAATITWPVLSSDFTEPAVN